MHPLNELCNKLESHLADFSKINNEVSSAPIGWHLQHSLLVMNGILGSLEHSNPEEYKWKFSLAGLYVIGLSRIPRGKGRVPEVVDPKSELDVDAAITLISKIRVKLTRIDALTAKHNYKHPRFHYLNKRRALKFIAIHTRHHLKIITDILKAS